MNKEPASPPTVQETAILCMLESEEPAYEPRALSNSELVILMGLTGCVGLEVDDGNPAK